MDEGTVAIVLRDRAHDFGELVRSAPDPDRPVHRSDWSIREVAKHVMVISEAYAEYLGGDTTPVVDVHDLAATNAAAVDRTEEVDVGVIADRIETATDRFVERAGGRGAGATMQWHGWTTPVDAVRGILLGELVMHSQDVAGTLDRPWPVTREDATVILLGTSCVAGHFVDPERSRPDAEFEIRLRSGPAFVLRFEDGRMDWAEGRADDADCRVSADPVALMQVLYARRGQWPAILQGRLVAFGRKPWLALGLSSRFSGF